MRDQPIWKQRFVAIAPWLVIASTLVRCISYLLGQNWTIEAIARSALGLPIILVCAEQITVRKQAVP